MSPRTDCLSINQVHAPIAALVLLIEAFPMRGSCPSTAYLSEPDSDLVPEFKFVVLHEDAASERHARRFHGGIARSLRGECSVSRRAWSFRELKTAEVREQAIREVLDAEMLILAVRGGHPIASPIAQWIETAADALQDTQTTVAALITGGTGSEEDPARTSLEDLADRLSLDLLIHDDQEPWRPRMSDGPEAPT